MEDNNYTLEQMRAEYQALKDTLSKQEIINDRLLRDTMRGKVGRIRGKASVSVVCGILVILSAPFVFHYNPVVNASWVFIIATELLMGGCIFLDWKFNRKVQSTNLAECDLLTFSKDVKKLKEDYQGWLKYGLILGAAWAVWLGIETWMNSSDPKLAISMICGLAFGFIAGAIIGYRLQRKIIKTCDEIISGIEG